MPLGQDAAGNAFSHLSHLHPLTENSQLFWKTTNFSRHLHILSCIIQQPFVSSRKCGSLVWKHEETKRRSYLIVSWKAADVSEEMWPRVFRVEEEAKKRYYHVAACFVLVSTGYTADYPRINRQEPETDHSPSSIADVNNDGPIPPLPHTSSWNDAWLIHTRDNFTFYYDGLYESSRTVLVFFF
jgi:hypothetical protein